MKNETVFKQYLALISEKFQVEISQAMGKMIWKVLEPHNDVQCKQGLDLVIRKGRFFKDVIPDLEDALGGGRIDQVTGAWVMVDEAMRRHGPYQSVDFGDPAIHRTIEILGGWEYLGTLTEEDWKWKRKEFESIYRGLPKANGPSYVMGLIERQNVSNGYSSEISAPIQIAQAEQPKTKRLKEG